MSADQGQILPPGSVIGILGGGQLGRMTAEAASRLGYRCHIYCPDPQAPAFDVAARSYIGHYEDHEKLLDFAREIDVITFEFENIPAATGEFLSRLKPTRPDPSILHMAQQRLREKRFLNSIDVPTAAFEEVREKLDMSKALEKIGYPAVLKSASFGYDGKGQARIENAKGIDDVWQQAMGGEKPDDGAILEAFVDFTMEISIVIARAIDGTACQYVPVENRHKNHILAETVAPAILDDAIIREASLLADRIAAKTKLVGLMGVEMFVTKRGEVLVNELAPRPHNSGHWTMDACLTSQFEQFVRAICGLPLGSTERHSNAIMRNLLGSEAEDWLNILKDPAAKLHLYGKKEARSGRKMGHVNRLFPKS